MTNTSVMLCRRLAAIFCIRNKPTTLRFASIDGSEEGIEPPTLDAPDNVLKEDLGFKVHVSDLYKYTKETKTYMQIDFDVQLE